MKLHWVSSVSCLKAFYILLYLKRFELAYCREMLYICFPFVLAWLFTVAVPFSHLCRGCVTAASFEISSVWATAITNNKNKSLNISFLSQTQLNLLLEKLRSTVSDYMLVSFSVFQKTFLLSCSVLTSNNIYVESVILLHNCFYIYVVIHMQR